MTQQENIDRDLRMMIGDMQLQLVFAKARIAALEEEIAQLEHRARERDKMSPQSNGAMPDEITAALRNQPFTQRPIAE